MLTRDVLKRYLLEMPAGHIFDLSYEHFADVFPPGEPDPAAREALRLLAEECDCALVNSPRDKRYELTRR